MAEDESITFMDLACVFRIGSDTTLEKFGSTINSSVFDAANISGTLKQKGLVDFTAYYPGPNSIVLTDTGKKLKEEAETKSTAPLDELDKEILVQMSGGKRAPLELQTTLNLRPRDLAMRIYKLSKQSYLGYDLANGNATLMLTEQGFLHTKAPKPMEAAAPMAMPQATMQMQQMGAQMPGQQPKAAPQQAPQQMPKPKRKFPMMYVLAVIIAVLLGAAAYYLHFIMHLF